jgi:hypothetical protein
MCDDADGIHGLPFDERDREFAARRASVTAGPRNKFIFPML